jgi:acetyl-CoA C-acetyltransferase
MAKAKRAKAKRKKPSRAKVNTGVKAKVKAKAAKKPAKKFRQSKMKQAMHRPAIRANDAADAFIFDHVRTPRGRGKNDGALHECTSLELARQTLVALKERNRFEPKLVEDIVLGCVDPVGEAGGDIARAAAIAADYGKEVPGVQINRFCASGLEAVNFAAAQVMSGQKEIAIGGGVESMSRVGIGASGGAWPMDPSVAIKSYFMPQGVSADLIATKYGFSRDDVDEYAVMSQRRAANAWQDKRFANSVLTVADVNGLPLLDHDEHMRPATDMQSLASLKPSFAQMGELGGFDAVGIQAHPEVERINHVHHAGNSSGIVDGAAAVLIGSKAGGKALGRKPRAKIRQFASIGSDLALMLTGPVDVTERVLKKAGMKISDIDLVELNEAFAAVVLRYMQYFAIDRDRINVNGGAIAMGHPLGATGAMILGTVLDELERTNKQTALVTLCIGAGMGTATIIERV